MSFEASNLHKTKTPLKKMSRQWKFHFLTASNLQNRKRMSHLVYLFQVYSEYYHINANEFFEPILIICIKQRHLRSQSMSLFNGFHIYKPKEKLCHLIELFKLILNIVLNVVSFNNLILYLGGIRVSG